MLIKAILHPLGYMPIVPTNIAFYAILLGFHPPPFVLVNQEKLNLLCPVKGLETYVHGLPSGVTGD